MTRGELRNNFTSTPPGYYTTTTIMKDRTCTKCKKKKPASTFERNGLKSDGSVRLRSICKECGSRRKLVRTDRRTCTKCGEEKEAADFQGRQSHCRDCRNQAAYAYRRGPGREAHNRRMVEYNRKRYKSDPSYRKKHIARQAVALAVREGRLVRPAACPLCGREAKLQAHHYVGYESENQLRIEWMCARCHRRAEA